MPDVVAGHIVRDVDQGEVGRDSERDALHGRDIAVGGAEVRGEGEYLVGHGEGKLLEEAGSDNRGRYEDDYEDDGELEQRTFEASPGAE